MRRRCNNRLTCSSVPGVPGELATRRAANEDTRGEGCRDVHARRKENMRSAGNWPITAVEEHLHPPRSTYQLGYRLDIRLRYTQHVCKLRPEGGRSLAVAKCWCVIRVSSIHVYASTKASADR